MDPHHFGNLDPHPHPHHHIKVINWIWNLIQIRSRIHIK
jgi:hypothetical protein